MSAYLTFFLPEAFSFSPDLVNQFQQNTMMLDAFRVPAESISIESLTSNKAVFKLSTLNCSTESIVDFKRAWRNASTDIIFQASDMHGNITTVECALSEAVFSAPKGMVFDMDSTLIQVEVIDELARVHGVTQQVADITEQAMQGKLDFTESFKARMRLLKGLSADAVQIIRDALPLTQGATELLNYAGTHQIQTLLVSGGFQPFADVVKTTLKMTAAHANDLAIENNSLTGCVVPPVIDGDQKVRLLKTFFAEHNIALSDVVAVGDGANDIPMINAVGVGVGFCAKEALSKAADVNILSPRLDSLVTLFK